MYWLAIQIIQYSLHLAHETFFFSWLEMSKMRIISYTITFKHNHLHLSLRNGGILNVIENANMKQKQETT